MRLTSIVLIGVTALLWQGPASAGSLWIQPAHYRPCVGKSLQVRLRTTVEAKQAGTAARAFFVMDARGVAPLHDTVGDPEQGTVEVIESGFVLLGYRGQPQPVSYGAVSRPGQALTNFAKALLVAGPQVPPQGHARRVGFPLELVPLDNPYRYRGGVAWRVLLVYRGQPLAYAPVSATHADSVHTLVATTDRAGTARFVFAHGGEWLLHAAHEAPAGNGPGHSTALSFELPRLDPTASLAAGTHCTDAAPRG